MIISLAIIYLYMYAVLLLAGAYFGHKVGSRISMIMGLCSGALVLVLLYLLHFYPQAVRTILILMSAVLCAIFTKRLLATGKFMPSGMLVTAAALAVMASIIIR